MLIGLTGRYCAGKNHVARLLERRGWEVLDVDKLGHLAVEQARETIAARFGPDILKADGSVDRQKLGSRVFGDRGKLAELEELVHPAANRMTERWIAERPDAMLAVNAALLHRSSVFGRLDAVILVTAPCVVRFARALRRDGISPAALLRRFSSQRGFESQYFRQKADMYIVRNTGAFGPFAAMSERKLERRIDSILARIGMVR